MSEEKKIEEESELYTEEESDEEVHEDGENPRHRLRVFPTDTLHKDRQSVKFSASVTGGAI